MNLGGFPGPLRKVLGIWSEEMDGLHDGQMNRIIPRSGNELELSGEYEAHELCDLIHTEGAEVLAEYGADFYAGRPAVTVNRYGEGEAYYIASRNKHPFGRQFFGKLAESLKISRVVECDLPHGVTAQRRSDGVYDYVFLLNFNQQEQQIELDSRKYSDFFNGNAVQGQLTLPTYGVRLLQRKCNDNAAT